MNNWYAYKTLVADRANKRMNDAEHRRQGSHGPVSSPRRLQLRRARRS